MILLLSRREGEGEREREEGGGGGMRNSIRCCISCILPCGALDVIRIVHCNGRVEEISGSIKAIDIMKAHPKHVLKKPSSSSSLCSTQEQGSGNGGVVPKIVVVPPDADLQRGKIYFLMPLPSPPPSKRKQKKKKEMNHNSSSSDNISVAKFSDRYLSEILSEKVSSESDHQRDRRRGRVAVWRPHLESISESPPNHLL